MTISVNLGVWEGLFILGLLLDIIATYVIMRTQRVANAPMEPPVIKKGEATKAEADILHTFGFYMLMSGFGLQLVSYCARNVVAL